MKLLRTYPNDEGHVLMLMLPEDAKIEVLFYDDGSVRDYTSMMPDFALVGLDMEARVRAGTDLAPSQEVEVASLQLSGVDEDQFFSFYVSSSQETLFVLDWKSFSKYATLGIVDQITAGVAHESAKEDL